MAFVGHGREAYHQYASISTLAEDWRPIQPIVLAVAGGEATIHGSFIYALTFKKSIYLVNGYGTP